MVAAVLFVVSNRSSLSQLLISPLSRFVCSPTIYEEVFPDGIGPAARCVCLIRDSMGNLGGPCSGMFVVLWRTDNGSARTATFAIDADENVSASPSRYQRPLCVSVILSHPYTRECPRVQPNDVFTVGLSADSRQTQSEGFFGESSPYGG